MDWEANLAAIIKCTDANLEQQFRHFEDITTGYSAGSGAAGVLSPSDADGNVAAAYLRETMAADYHRAQQQQPQQQPQHQQTPSYSRVSSAFPTPTSSFSGHFHRRQERNRGTPVKDNQRADRGGREREPMGGEGQMHDYDGDDGRFAPTRPSGGSGMHHMYTSPTYDMAQMMEQVRLSLKLEVDARAAIAERQLSALLQLCKATSEELDRLRVEVCANDRQLHTLDQTQSKIRQELTTQKDIGFHLQSMCGKDESWRMQAENQLLELRQMVAALREQGNSTQAVAQEKLSRSELLVQFNAAMEPIKAQLQANLQHQAQQIAEVTRTTSSSSLLLDGLTQKVNRGLTDEISELRSDLNALKHHVAKIDIFQDSRGVHYDKLQRSSSSPHSKEQKEERAKEEQIEQGKKMQEVHDGLVKSVMVLAKDYTDARTKQIHQLIEDNASRAANKGELETLQRLVEEGCRSRCAAVVAQIDGQVKSTHEQLRHECSTAVRDVSDRIERAKLQMTDAMTAILEARSSALQSKQLDLVKMIEKEHEERKHALDGVQEVLRKTRHGLEDELHALSHEHRSNFCQHGSDIENRIKQVEKQVESTMTTLQKDTQTTAAALAATVKSQCDNYDVEWEQKLKHLEETISKTNLELSSLSNSVASLTARHSAAPINGPCNKEVDSALEKQVSTYASTMESLLQKMQLQLQAQSQIQMTMPPSPYHGYWPPSTYASNQPPLVLQLPPTTASSSSAGFEVKPEFTTATVASTKTSAPAPPALSSIQPLPSNPLPETVLGASATESMQTFSKSDDSKPAEVSSAALPVNSSKGSDLLVTPAPANAPSAQTESTTSFSMVTTAEASKGSQRTTRDLGENANGDQINKREHTIATTAKGAMAEAELAKARVESRRKLEMELKQQQQIPSSAFQSKVNTSTGSTGSNSASPTENEARRASVPAILSNTAAPSPPQSLSLPRSASSSALPVKASVSSLSAQQSTQIQAPTSAVTSSIQSTPPPRAPVIESTLPPPPHRPPVTRTSDTKSVSIPPTSNTLGDQNSVPPPIPNAPSAMTPQGQHVLSPSLHSVPIKSATQDEHSPPTSPLAKIFARSPRAPEAAIVKNPLAETRPAQPPSVASPNSLPTAEIPQAPPSLAPPPSKISLGASGSAIPVSHVLCGQCRLPIRSDQKTDHESSQCSKRMVECVNCNQKMPWSSLEMHVLDCHTADSSTAVDKTKVQAQLNSDAESKTASETENLADLGGSIKRCRHCAADIPSLDLLEHEITCDKVLKQCPHCLRRQKMSDLQDHIENCDCRLVSCPNGCGSKFLQRGIPNHLASRCPSKPVGGVAVATGPAPPSSTPYPLASKPAAPPIATKPPAVSNPSEMVECKFCDDEIQTSEIEAHEQDCDWRPKRCQHCNMVVISRDLVRHETSCKTNLKSCPHCNESLPQSALATHTARCSKRPIKCIRCCQLFPADSIVAHSTNCKLVPGATSTALVPQSQKPMPPAPDPRFVPTSDAYRSQQAALKVPMKIPPPPPFPPPSASPVSPPTSQLTARRASVDPRMKLDSVSDTAVPTAAEDMSDRLARRNLALSQLINPGPSVIGGRLVSPQRNSGGRASAPSLHLATASPTGTAPESSVDEHDEEEDVEEDEDEDDEDEEEDQLTLAQVVTEWNVENVCLWLHEDVGVPDVVTRFQQRQCNGEMLLELTESDLINDFGVQNRLDRERILNAIEAIKTSDVFSDDEEEDEDDDEGDGDGSEGEEDSDEDGNGVGASSATDTHAGPRHSFGGESFAHPRDILRRKSQASPQRTPDSSLPSSNAMLRRISKVLENPSR